jgi:hypothetical protein
MRAHAAARLERLLQLTGRRPLTPAPPSTAARRQHSANRRLHRLLQPVPVVLQPGFLTAGAAAPCTLAGRFLRARRAYSGLADGSYTFQVQALGAAGAPATAGPAAAAAFLVDTAPPTVSALRFAAAAAGRTAAVAAAPTASLVAAPAAAAGGGGATVVLADGAFTAMFSVTDGVLGSGVNGCPHPPLLPGVS